MATIALTGATGLVGSVLVPILLERGHTVRALARPRPGRTLPARQGLTWIAGCLDEIQPIDELVHGADAILHLAYMPPAGAPVQGRTVAEHWLQNNLIGSLRLLERAASTRGRQLVYVSSLAVFGADPDLDPLGARFVRDEEFPLWPREFYGSLRAATEKLVVTAAHAHGLNTSVFRFGCVIGLREPWTDSPLHQTVREAVLHGEIRTTVGTYSLGATDAARILADAVGDDRVRGQVFNTFDRWFDHADAAPWLAELLGREVRVACARAVEPRSPIRGERIHARYRPFATEPALRALVAALVTRLRPPE